MKNRIRIPCQFDLFGFTIKVKWDDNLKDGHEECYGMAERDTSTITLQTPHSDYEIAQVEQTFIHETLHLILEYGGYVKEDNNEKFVEHMANLLHQMIVTSHYCDVNDDMVDYNKIPTF